MSKPKVITEFEKLDENLRKKIKLQYPFGFEKHLITFKNHKRHLISALPYDTSDRQYLVKMTREKANTLISNDEDYNENGILKAESKATLEEEIKNMVTATVEAKEEKKAED